MTYYQFAGLGIFLLGFLNLYALVTRIDHWRERLGPAHSLRAARIAILVYALGFIAFPMLLGLALIYVLNW
jgi:hypothetical protein